MTPKFSGLVNPTFHYVLGLLERVERGEGLDLDAERNAVRNELEDAQLTARSPDSPVKPQEFELVKQALVYWVDEVMTAAVPEWQNNTLEREYYKSRDRAWKFYTVGETQARKSTPDVVEVWYLALVLGFEGDIVDAFKGHLNWDHLPGGATQADDARAKWAAELARQIRQSQLGELQAEPISGDVRPLSGARRLAIAVPCTAAALAAFCALLAAWLKAR